MVKIKKFFQFNSNGNVVDFELENGVLLFREDWNGELYSTGWDLEKKKETDTRFKPIYKMMDEINYEIIGFEEI